MSASPVAIYSSAPAPSGNAIPVCFVIMPIADMDPYPAGHFRRVYEHIIKPACSLAGMTPLRADDVNQTNHIVLDVLRHILNADMAVCDLSARNPNVFYELGVRQAFNKPVSLIKDIRTPRVFDIQGLRDIEYDDGLRVDTIEPTVALLADSLRKTLASHSAGDSHVNSLVQLLGLSAASLPKASELSPEGNLVLSALAEMSSRLAAIEQVSRGRSVAGLGIAELEALIDGAPQEWSADERERYLRSLSSSYIPGMRVRHRKFGAGEVIGTSGTGRDEKVRILFDDEAAGRKTLVAAQANLEVLESGSSA